MNERVYLAIAMLPYLVASAHAFYTIGAGHWRPNVWNGRLIIAGFIFHTLFLVGRGQKLGHCPISNLFEVILFLSWSIVLSYLLLGSFFRVSLLGLLTAPLAFLINLCAFLYPGLDTENAPMAMGYWVELHAGLTMLSFGAFGLAAMSSVLYLVMDRALKHKNSGEMLGAMPPLFELDVIGLRVGWLAWVIFTVGLLSGFAAMNFYPHAGKLAWSGFVWLIFALILSLRHFQKMSPMRFSWLMAIGYIFVLVTFWAVNLIGKWHTIPL